MLDPASDPAPADRPSPTPRPRAILGLSAWCGLLAGWLEVGALILKKSTFDINHLYGITRHFVWLIPLVDLGLFLGLGGVLAIAARAWPRRGGWLAVRVLGALTLLPAVMVAFPQIYAVAWLLVLLGVSSRVVAPLLERRASVFGRTVRFSLPFLAALVPGVAAPMLGAGWGRPERGSDRPAPPTGSPNVLLLVMDTVAADHLGLYGYGRPTSPTLDELARMGVRFDDARAASSWTLPSHATMFTGRWPHDLSVGWVNPLDRKDRTLAEYLDSRGYDTAGFVANTLYCATDSGLGRGFDAYHDYIFPRLTAFKPAALVDRTIAGLQDFERFLEDRLDLDIFRPAVQRVWLAINGNRKDAATVNREFLGWLNRRGPSSRPFFAFLNYYDAHWPYQPPDLSLHRFGVPPRDPGESDLIQNWSSLDKKGLTESQIAFARDAYDDCIATLDEQIGCLVDELGRRGLRENTWLIVLADHGESFGEHEGVFCHGTSLYRTEVHVPLIIVPPSGLKLPGLAGRRVAGTASLRDIAATVVNLAGVEDGSPFTGATLARFWNGLPAPDLGDAEGRALSEVVPYDPLDPAADRLIREPRWPLGALSDGEWTYIRREGEIREELFHVRVDARESRNLAADPTAQVPLERMRRLLGGLTDGPLTPGRFNP
ncbi:MAG: sulfatase [Isosphaeraceae bacterium]